MKTWTIDEMLTYHPCSEYDREWVTALWAGREMITTREILASDIPAADRVWAALQDETIAPRVIERIVTRAVTDHVLRCGVAVVERWAQRWLSGEDRTAAAARAAARAAWAAARAAGAAGAAAWAAGAAEAAGAAAWAAWAAAGAAGAAGAAARAAGAAWAVECDRQIADIRAVLDEDDHG